ncbi:MAG: putative transposase/invertase (TIGR01784 family) [Phenylobacterium sp.]|jgi:predicted transposase/invertase (TIGR01784 family)
MYHYIDATIDCVFKAILASLGNEHVLVHFLNCTLQPKTPITSVKILNPYNEKEFLTDKLSIVDIKAEDASNVKYQIEIQLSTPTHLANRMLYNWCDMYKTQIAEGQIFSELKPVISIWLLTGNYFNDKVQHHHFQMHDKCNDVLLTDHCSVHVLELEKWCKPKALQPSDYWLYFFKEAKHWHELPDQLQHFEELRQAMKVLHTFSEKQKSYHLYQARVNYVREQQTLEAEYEKQMKLAEGMAELAEEERVLKELAEARAQDAEIKVEKAKAKVSEAEAKAEKAQVEQERLKKLLLAQGIDPESV